MRPFLTLHHPAKARGYYEAGLWQKDTFYTLLRENAGIAPETIALIDGETALSWQMLLERVDALAFELSSYGLRIGDRVCGWMSDRAEMVITMLACAREGYVFNPSFHRSLPPAQLGQMLERLSARVLVMEDEAVSDQTRAQFSGILANIPSLRAIYTAGHFPRPAQNGNPWQDDPDAVCYLAHTAGSSGPPKCVMHSANTLLSNARELVRDWRLDREAVIYSISPLSHHIAWVAFCQWLLTGSRFVLNAPPQGCSTLDWILQTKASYVLGVPTHALDILTEEAKRGCGFGAIKSFYLAAALIPPELCEALLARAITPQNIYGMIENSSHNYTMPHDSHRVLTTTCGRGGMAYQVRIFDENDPDRELPHGQVGQIGGKGAALMLGYFNNQAATETAFNRDGWFLSGDLGRMDAEGNLHIVGRLKDVIVRGGHYIYPEQIEQLVMKYDNVTQAACVPLPDARLGERVCLVTNRPVQGEALSGYLRAAGLSRYDLPEFLLELKDLPLLPNGNIDKRQIIERLQSQDLVPRAC